MKRLLAGLAGLLLLTGCGGRPAADWSSFAPGEEERLVIYTSHPQSLYEPVVKEFEERTGIWVQVETGGTAELLDRLEAEKDRPACDLLFGGGADSLTARRELFAPYISPESEHLDGALRCADGTWSAFSVVPVVLVYNPVLVRMNPPTGWESLLDPVWRGRIAFASPLVSGGSYTALATMKQVLPDVEDVLEAFYRNLDGRVLSEIGAVVDEVADAVADGSCTVGVTLESAALEAAEAGRDVALLYPEEGTSAVVDGMAVIAGCAHEENARRFVDFTLGEDAQRYLAENCWRRPVRSELVREEPEALILDYDLDRAAAERDGVLQQWRELEEQW